MVHLFSLALSFAEVISHLLQLHVADMCTIKQHVLSAKLGPNGAYPNALFIQVHFVLICLDVIACKYRAVGDGLGGAVAQS